MTHRLRRLLGVTVATVTAAALLAGCAAGSAEPASAPSGLAAAGDSIPEVTIKAGLSPYGDELLAAAAIKRGYFADAGITIGPDEYGAQTDLIASLAPLQNGQVELGSGYPPAVVSQLDNVDDVTAFAISDVFYGYRILAPKGEYKTVAEEMKKGKSFAAALKTVLAQIKGEKVILRQGVVPTFYDLITKEAGTTTADWDVTYLPNADIVRAAQAGQADFVSPTGAVEITRLLQDGWESLVELPQVIENLPSEDTVSLRATFSGYLTTTKYADENWDTLLRFTGVMYRIVADMKADPEATAADYVDYLNSYTGSSLTAAELAGTFDGLYSLRDFDDAKAMYTDKKDPFHFDTVAGAQIDELTAKGVLKGEHTTEQLSIAGKIYADLAKYRSEAKKLLDAGDGDADLLAKAKTLYDQYDFLDAYRFAAQAAQG
ncbi:ABC transporter substrate-binding protein [Schumannella sp. 10F1B-5-1]|uniref:ABC transporter substrate-binding protein n=1 Tax=Schumannella sp. 10F1B-5-1 TaxID=2590780 RepID=UPI0011323ABD|nr:ABC transporter substrate-binding protein [Schumannella sp. 10F1B-5-1]TPW78276.1 ABC transporter substrate-binding protein [Schumannella sp. 10F1B-5-1]